MSDGYRVSATGTLASTWIEDNSGTRQATKRDVSITVKDGIHTRDDYLSVEMWETNDECSVLNLWKFEDLDEAEALAELILDRVEEIRTDRELGLYE